MFEMYLIRILMVVILASASVLDVHCTRVPMFKHNLSDGKIVGGSATTIQQYPYQALLSMTQAGTGDVFQCGGSIINERCVLTAAHCLDNFVSVKIRVGSTNTLKGGHTYNSMILIKHPKYDRMTGDYDVGIIKLLTPITIDGKNTTAAKLPTSKCNVATGTNLTVTGWGVTEEDGSTTTTLMKVTIDAVSRKECKKNYPDLTSRMICAGVPEGGKDSCQGDSGGPLVKTGTKTQVGIVSYGIGCGRPDIPGIYTNLCYAEIQNWLRYMNCN